MGVVVTGLTERNARKTGYERERRGVSLSAGVHRGIRGLQIEV